MRKHLKILIIGNGFGGVYTLKNLDKIFHKNKNVHISLIGEKNYFLFTPLLHEVATGSINRENIIEPIRKVLGRCLDNFYLGKVDFINLTDKIVHLNKDVISYDYLVLAPGSQTNFYDIEGAEKYSFTLKSLEDAVKIKNHIIRQVETATHIHNEIQQQNKLTFVIVGGGPTGVEFAAELQELIQYSFSQYYSKEIIKKVRIILIQQKSELVPQFGERIRTKSLRKLEEKGIKVLLNTKVVKVDQSFITINNNEQIPTEAVIWVAGIKPVNIDFNENVDKNKLGQIKVNEYLQIKNHKDVFVIGDLANAHDVKSNAPLPALAQVAEKQAKNVALNIKNILQNKKLEPFVYKNSGRLMSIGQWMAVGEISNFVISGRITWWIWRTVYLFKLISWRKKVRVAFDWTLNLFSARDISQF